MKEYMPHCGMVQCLPHIISIPKANKQTKFGGIFKKQQTNKNTKLKKIIK